ncbi:MAG: ABC transporter permease [Armatimonadota bacterium]|nr:ABC transporter permease [Armatimonadota bacterium]
MADLSPQRVLRAAVVRSPGWGAGGGLVGRIRALAVSLAAPAVLLAVWEGLASLGALPAFLVSPRIVARELTALAASGELFEHASASLYRSLTGFAMGSASGLALGLLSGVAPKVAGFFDPLVSLTNPVPKVAILPMLVVWFGISDLSKILLIAISCFYPCFIAAFHGVRSVDPLWIWAARNMGARPLQAFFRVVVPATSAQVFNGLRVALALSFILMLASELMGSSNRTGLGFLLLSADAGGRFDLMFAAIAAIAMVGLVCDRLLLTARRALVHGEQEGGGTHG